MSILLRQNETGATSEVIPTLLLLAGTALFLRQLLGIAFECDELAHELAVNIHDGGIIVEVTAVIFSTEDRDELLVFAKEAVAVFHDLVAAANEIKVVLT